jgi:hypothetical protein
VLAAGDVARVTLDIPEPDSIASELCPKKRDGVAPLFVVLREEHSGKPAGNYRVEARWTPPTDSSGAPLGRAGGVRALTDWRGEFVACDVPAGANVSFRTTTGDAQWSLPIRIGAKLNVLRLRPIRRACAEFGVVLTCAHSERDGDLPRRVTTQLSQPMPFRNAAL